MNLRTVYHFSADTVRGCNAEFALRNKSLSQLFHKLENIWSKSLLCNKTGFTRLKTQIVSVPLSVANLAFENICKGKIYGPPEAE